MWPRPTPRSGCPGGGPRRPTCGSTRWSRLPGRSVPTRCTRATGSSPRTRRSPRAVQRAGLVWVGPPPDAIEAMGSKIAARKLVAAAGVPVLPEHDPALVRAEDLPLLVKASAGGGGRGMRVVRALDELPAAVREASAEAAAAFGEPAVFCERYVQRGRHIEVQVLADAHGTVWAVGARECSLQRRHQKVARGVRSRCPPTHHRMAHRMTTAAVGCGARRRLRGCRHRGVHLGHRRHRRRRRVLLPGDEHPAAG